MTPEKLIEIAERAGFTIHSNGGRHNTTVMRLASEPRSRAWSDNSFINIRPPRPGEGWVLVLPNIDKLYSALHELEAQTACTVKIINSSIKVEFDAVRAD